MMQSKYDEELEAGRKWLEMQERIWQRRRCQWLVIYFIVLPIVICLGTLLLSLQTVKP